MQAIGVRVDVLVGRHMQLHGRFVVLEEGALDVFHLRPVGAAVLARDADVVPIAIGGGDERDEYVAFTLP